MRLDERQLAHELGISRTPVREAMVQLEREGFVRSVPRRGIYVARKTKRQVVEMIVAWAALESMAARLITQYASDEEIATLRHMFATFDSSGAVVDHLDEYSEVNIQFHQTIIRMSGNNDAGSRSPRTCSPIDAHDPRQGDRGGMTVLSGPFHARSHVHHRCARGARYRSVPPRVWCAITRFQLGQEHVSHHSATISTDCRPGSWPKL